MKDQELRNLTDIPKDYAQVTLELLNGRLIIFDTSFSEERINKVLEDNNGINVKGEYIPYSNIRAINYEGQIN